MSRTSAAVATVLVLSGCAASYQPIIDSAGVDQNRYQADLAQCRAFAAQVDPAGQAAAGAAGGAIFGAALGAIAGAFLHNAAVGAALGAALGGTEGVAGGGAHGLVEQKQVIDNCLRHRGYAVLN